jgi:hypothetical protein
MLPSRLNISPLKCLSPPKLNDIRRSGLRSSTMERLVQQPPETGAQCRAPSHTKFTLFSKATLYLLAAITVYLMGLRWHESIQEHSVRPMAQAVGRGAASRGFPVHGTAAIAVPRGALVQEKKPGAVIATGAVRLGFPGAKVHDSTLG